MLQKAVYWYNGLDHHYTAISVKRPTIAVGVFFNILYVIYIIDQISAGGSCGQYLKLHLGVYHKRETGDGE